MAPQRQLPISLCLVVCISLLIVPPVVSAQASTSVRGTVSDPAGKPLRGASITLANVGTAASRTTVSDEAGSYQSILGALCERPGGHRPPLQWGGVP